MWAPAATRSRSASRRRQSRSSSGSSSAGSVTVASRSWVRNASVSAPAGIRARTTRSPVSASRCQRSERRATARSSAVEQTGVGAVLVLTAAQPCAVPLELRGGRSTGRAPPAAGRSPGAPHGSAHAPSNTTPPPQRTRHGSPAARATVVRHGPVRVRRPSRHRTASSTSAHTTTPATTPTPTGVVLTDHHQERTRRRREMRRQRPHLLLQTLQRHRVTGSAVPNSTATPASIAIGHRGSPPQVQAAALTLRTGCDTDR